jgi:phosphoglycerol transferase MdoB-like AlkP superfamily enzyme
VRATLFFRFVLFHLLLFTILRFAFYFSFLPSGDLPSADVLRAFWLGLRFDLRLALLLLLPMIIFGWRSLSPVSGKKTKKMWSLVYTFIASSWFVFYIFDFGFYGYLNSRMNSAILSFLESPEISFGMLWQSYPVLLISAAFVVMLVGYLWLIRKFVFEDRPSRLFLIPKLPINVAFICLFLVGLYGSASQYPLRWSESFFSPHHFLSHLSLNPILYFFETYSFAKKKSYDVEQVQKYYPIMKEYVGITGDNRDDFLIPRKVVPQNTVDRPFNVVVIVMESMALSKTDIMNNPLKPTPYLAAIAEESLLFTNYYSPVEGTARNMFSIITSIPDVTKVETSTRNPMVVDQKVIANAFKNYKKMYLLGGSASWANIRGIFSHNIEGIDIVEEGSFDKGSVDVWGISDLDLFVEADKRFSALPKDQPFFAVIQSASFHRPYTIPKNALKFERQPNPIEKLQEAGFYSQDQFDSIRFSDYSLGHFLELAKKKDYYKNTLFVITGDHGLPDDNGINVNAGSHLWELEKYHVPLILHNSQLVPKPRVDARNAGHADIMTTVASLVGVPHDNTTLGRDLFNPEYDKERYSFIYNVYSQIGEFGLIGPKYYYRFDDIQQGQLYELLSAEPEKNLKLEYPEVFQRMEELAKAHMEYSRFLLFNNGKG